MEIRAYQTEDRDGCVALDAGMSAYLEAGRERFSVLEHEGRIVGCGGYRVEGNRAVLEWGVVRSDVRGMGVGRYLLMARLKQIAAEPGVEFAEARVARQWAGFYVKQGFRVEREEGDRVVLVKRLVVCG